MGSPQEQAAMRRALDAAARGPAHGPNPRVGCVVLDPAGAIAGEGWHRGAGTEHAEVVALRRAGAAARGGTAVVTLEPCNHTGRTPPCTQALLDAGVARVVVGATDPNPLAAGGLEQLRRAGVEVEVGVLGPECAQINRRWLFAVRHRRPFVTWKYAATLDGRVAAVDGSSRWITGEAARADVHARRAAADAVVVGTGTALADDPWLTVRDAAGRPLDRQPLRVVVGDRPVPATARVRDAAAPTLLLGRQDPEQVLARLQELEVRHVWLEGGPALAAAFWRAGLVDEVIAYLAPALLGSGRPALGDLGIGDVTGTLRLHPVRVEQLGADTLIVAVPDPVRRRPGAASGQSAATAATTDTAATTTTTTTDAGPPAAGPRPTCAVR